MNEEYRVIVQLERFSFLPDWLSWIPGYYINVDLVVKLIDGNTVDLHIGSYANRLITVENHKPPPLKHPEQVPPRITT